MEEEFDKYICYEKLDWGQIRKIKKFIDNRFVPETPIHYFVIQNFGLFILPDQKKYKINMISKNFQLNNLELDNFYLSFNPIENFLSMEKLNLYARINNIEFSDTPGRFEFKINEETIILSFEQSWRNYSENLFPLILFYDSEWKDISGKFEFLAKKKLY